MPSAEDAEAFIYMKRFLGSQGSFSAGERMPGVFNMIYHLEVVARGGLGGV